MQKRSWPAEIRYHEIVLEEDFPIWGGAMYRQKDHPITFLHFHRCLELGYCYAGHGVFVVGEKILPFQAGDVSFIAANDPHLARSAPGTSSEWAWIYLDPLLLVGREGADFKMLEASRYAGARFENILKGSQHPEITRLVEKMAGELRGQKRGRKDALRALAWQLMVEMARLVPRGKREEGLRTEEYERIAPALGYMSRHFARPVNIPETARLCRMSRAHFRRVFHRALGMSPREYWHAMRLRMAASLLGSSAHSILEISQEVGFESLSSFNRLFLKRMGMPPRKWRKKLKN